MNTSTEPRAAAGDPLAAAEAEITRLRELAGEMAAEFSRGRHGYWYARVTTDGIKEWRERAARPGPVLTVPVLRPAQASAPVATAPAPAPRTKRCPRKGCTAMIPWFRLLCPADWRRVPGHLRDAAERTHRDWVSARNAAISAADHDHLKAAS